MSDSFYNREGHVAKPRKTDLKGHDKGVGYTLVWTSGKRAMFKVQKFTPSADYRAYMLLGVGICCS